MRKTTFAVRTVKLNTHCHQFNLINFKDDSFKIDKILYHIRFNVIDVWFRVILDCKIDLFWSFVWLWLLYVTVQNKAGSLNNHWGIILKSTKDLH